MAQVDGKGQAVHYQAGDPNVAYNQQGMYVQQGGMPGQYQQGVPGQQAPIGNIPYIPPQPGVPGAAQQVQFMARPAAIPGVPPGLEYLTQVDQLLVHQQVEIFEMMTNWETNNRYQIKNSVGQQVYFAMEESDLCMRQCCKNARGFVMHITDNLGQEVIRVNREFKCCAGCCCCAFSNCCQMVVTIEAPVGTVIGSCVQQCSAWSPKFEVRDGNEQRVFGIDGPCCIFQGICCTGDVEFKVTAGSGESEVGKISKQWMGIAREMFTTADNFGVTFPMDLDVRMKAVLLGCVFLIDFMYFEQKNNK